MDTIFKGITNSSLEVTDTVAALTSIKGILKLSSKI